MRNYINKFIGVTLSLILFTMYPVNAFADDDDSDDRNDDENSEHKDSPRLLKQEDENRINNSINRVNINYRIQYLERVLTKINTLYSKIAISNINTERKARNLELLSEIRTIVIAKINELRALGYTQNTPDTTPPITSAISISSITNISAIVGVTSNEAGVGYYIALTSGMSAPTVRQVVEGIGGYGVTSEVRGSFNLVSGLNPFTVSGLNPGTSYNLYFVAKDTKGNFQTSTTNVTFTTSFASDSSQIPSNIVTPSSSVLGHAISRITLSAQYDDLQLTDIYLKNIGSLSNLAARAKFYLYDNNNVNISSPLAVGFVTTDTISFNIGNNSSVIIPRYKSVTLVVYAKFNDITDAVDSGKTIILTNGFNPANTTAVSGTDSSGIRLISRSSGNNVISIGGSFISNVQLLTRSKPYVVISGQDYNSHTIAITADANSNIRINSLTLSSVSLPTNVTYSYRLYKDSVIDSNLLTTGILSNGIIMFSAPVEIAAGQTKNFYLNLTINSGSPTVGSTRIIKISDISYTDIMQTGGNVIIPSVAGYSNIGIPTIESRYQY